MSPTLESDSDLWEIGWNVVPEPLPAEVLFVFSRSERRVVLFERFNPWSGHLDAIRHCFGDAEAGCLGAGVVIGESVRVHCGQLAEDATAQLREFLGIRALTR